MKEPRLPDFVRDNYEVHEWRHALAILRSDFSVECADIMDVLSRFRLRRSWITVGGGRKSKVAEWIDRELLALGWRPKNFDTKITVDERSVESPTHEVDCFKNRVALEIEWNGTAASFAGFARARRPTCRHHGAHTMSDVVLEIRGGQLVEVYTDSPALRFVLVDWDNIRCADRACCWQKPSRLSFMPVDTDARYRAALDGDPEAATSDRL
jgi:hypothetical protein